MTRPDPFIEEVRQLKDNAANRTPTRDQLADRLKEIEQQRSANVTTPNTSTDAA